MPHYTIIADNATHINTLIKSIYKGEQATIALASTNVFVFSQQTLDHFIAEESKHETNAFGKQPIKTLSGGEQKKAMLHYLVTQQPETLVIHNPFDHLDVASQKKLKDDLAALSQTCQLIVISSRKKDILPFSNTVLYAYNNVITNKEHTIENQTGIEIPKPITSAIKTPETLILFDHVSVSYEGKPILNQINWKVKTNEFWQLIGPNGSGKSTMLTMINGDNPKAFGQNIYLFGNKKGSGETVWELKEKMGYYTNSMVTEFTGNHSAQEMIIGGLFDSVGLYNKASEMQLHCAKAWLNTIGLSQKASVKFNQLSLGEQRMVLIARAMIKHPPLLILDEPTTGLDDNNTALLVRFVNEIAEQTSTTILYVSHRAEEGLQPTCTIELFPSEEGSTSKITS